MPSISGDVATLVGATPGRYSAALWLECSQPILVVNNEGRLGGRMPVPLADDGTFTVTGLPTSVVGVPLYRLVADSRDLHRGGNRDGITTGWFALTANRDLAWIVANYVPTTVVSEQTAANIAAAAALGATNDTATASYINNATSATGVALEEAFADHGIRVGDPARTIDNNAYVKLQSSHDNAAGMVIWTQKVAGDSTDVNVDGSIIVKHGKQYTATPGYADTLQVYTLAGSAGTIIGNNDYAGYESSLPYTPGVVDGAGYVRFECGPLWPRSEVGRFNNAGDFMLGGWQAAVTGRTYTQSGTTVTQVGGADAFTANHVGSYMLWDGSGGDGHADRITAFIDATHVTVERARTISTAQGGSVRRPTTLIRNDSTVETDAGLKVKARVGQSTNLFEVQNAAGERLFVVDGNGGSTGALLVAKTVTTNASYATSSATDADIAAAFEFSFVAPHSGKVLAELSATVDSGASVVDWTVRSGTTTVAVVTMGTGYSRKTAEVVLTGLTPGTTYTYRWGHKRLAGSTACTIYNNGAGGASGLSLMKVTALP